MLHGTGRYGHAELLDGRGVEVEGWRCRHDDSSSLGEGGHVAQVDKRVGCFACHDDQLTALFEHDIGTTLDKTL